MSDLPHRFRWLLRRSDQVAVAALVAVALAAMVGWWIAQGGRQGMLIETDQTTPLSARFEVDINTADLPELMQLPGIGPTLAWRIIESRETEGPFVRVDDLRRVSGIGQKRLEQIRPFLRSNPRTPPPTGK